MEIQAGTDLQSLSLFMVMLLTMQAILTKGPPRKRGANFPEVIIRKTCTFVEQRNKAYPIPELLLLANRAGFLWLSKVFARCARKTGDAQAGDPDDHEHVDACNPEFNPIHSDEMALRLGILTRVNRRAVFQKYELTQRKRFKGDLPRQYQRQVVEVRSQWRRVLAMERQQRTREEKESRQWKSALDKLRRKQERDLKRSAGDKSAQPRKLRRLFRAVAEIKVGPGFRRLQNRGCAEPVGDGRHTVRTYVFARTRREASQLFAHGLSSAGYKVTKLSDVALLRSHRPTGETLSIRPEDVLRAWETGEVLLGWCWY